jgi:hypothetical protein
MPPKSVAAKKNDESPVQVNVTTKTLFADKCARANVAEKYKDPPELRIGSFVALNNEDNEALIQYCPTHYNNTNAYDNNPNNDFINDSLLPLFLFTFNII